MKTTLFMVISLNGIIAGTDGNEDFLSNRNWEIFCELANNSGGFIWGRKTYELVKNWGDEYFKPIEHVKKIILTTNTSYVVDAGYRIANSPTAALTLLQSLGIENAIITGGSTINSAFMKAGLIDEIKLNIEPAVVGKGIPLFKNEDFYNKLKPKDIKELEDGIFQLTYEVIK